MKIYWFKPVDRTDLGPPEAFSDPPRQNFPLTLAKHLRLYSQMVEVKIDKRSVSNWLGNLISHGD